MPGAKRSQGPHQSLRQRVCHSHRTVTHPHSPASGLRSQAEAERATAQHSLAQKKQVARTGHSCSTARDTHGAVKVKHINGGGHAWGASIHLCKTPRQQPAGAHTWKLSQKEKASRAMPNKHGKRSPPSLSQPPLRRCLPGYFQLEKEAFAVTLHHHAYAWSPQKNQGHIPNNEQVLAFPPGRPASFHRSTRVCHVQYK